MAFLLFILCLFVFILLSINLYYAQHIGQQMLF